mgnify:CR=1 FL=1
MLEHCHILLAQVKKGQTLHKTAIHRKRYRQTEKQKRKKGNMSVDVTAKTDISIKEEGRETGKKSL